MDKMSKWAEKRGEINDIIYSEDMGEKLDVALWRLLIWLTVFGGAVVAFGVILA